MKQDKAIARRQLHQAVQIPAAAARSFLLEREDDSYASLEWLSRYGALASQWFGTTRQFRVALRIAEFKLLFLDGNSQVAGAYILNNRTWAEATDWVKHLLEEFGLPVAAYHLDLPYEIPKYATSKRRPFEHQPPQAFSEMARYFSMTDEILKNQTKYLPNASPIRCWPHHFDMSTLITIKSSYDPEQVKSVSAGFSPGDNSYHEPYFFITPWPYPNAEITDLPDLADKNFWHTAGWTGLILSAESIIHTASSEMAELAKFFAKGIPVVQALIED